MVHQVVGLEQSRIVLAEAGEPAAGDQGCRLHLVFEQFDGLGENIAESMSVGFYQNEHRSTFVRIKIS